MNSGDYRAQKGGHGQEWRLNRIYATDALSFLPRHWLDKCRWVSSHYHGTLVVGRANGKLRAREQFDCFSITVLSSPVVAPSTHIPPPNFQTNADDRVFTSDGYGTLENTDTLGYRIVDPDHGRDWRTIGEYHRCCGDWLSAVAPQLSGQKIFLSAAPSAQVTFSCMRPCHWGRFSVALALRNELTPASAATLLHYIHHVYEQLYFKHHERLDGNDGLEQCGRFNPAILSSMAMAKKQPVGGWIRSVRALGGVDCRFIRLLPYQEALRDIVTVGRLDCDYRNVFMPHPGTDTSAVVQFVTQCGRCVGGELTVHIDVTVTHQKRVEFLEMVVKVRQG